MTLRVLTLLFCQERRLGEFIGGQYGQYNLASLLFEGRTDKKDVIELERWDPPGESKPTFQEARKQSYHSFKKGDSFGPSW